MGLIERFCDHVPFFQNPNRGANERISSHDEEILPPVITQDQKIPPGYLLHSDEEGRIFYFQDIFDSNGNPVLDNDGYVMQEIVYLPDE